NGPPRFPSAISIRRNDDPCLVLRHANELATLERERLLLRDRLATARGTRERAEERPRVILGKRRYCSLDGSFGAHGASTPGCYPNLAPSITILWDLRSCSYFEGANEVLPRDFVSHPKPARE